MNKKQKNHKVSDVDRLKTFMKQTGENLAGKQSSHQQELSDLLSREYDNFPETGFVEKLKSFVLRPVMLAPLGGLLAIIIFVNVADQPKLSFNQATDSIFPTSMNWNGDGEVRKELALGSSVEKSMYGIAPYDDVDEYEESNIVGYDKIAEKKSLMEQDLTINLIITKNIESVDDYFVNLFDNCDGFLEKVNMSNHSNSHIYLNGKIPLSRLSDFKNKLRELTGSDKYYREVVLHAQTKTPNLILIEQKIDDLEMKILELKIKIENENNDSTKIILEEDLLRLEASLNHSNEDKTELMAKVNYIDVSLTINQYPSFWQVREFNDMKMLITGFEASTVWQNLIINFSYLMILLLIFFSWTFWLLPVLIWLIFRRIKRQKIVKEME